MDYDGTQALADWAGQHALVLFMASLALLLTASWAFWRALLRHAGGTGHTKLSPPVAFGLRVAVGFVVILSSGALFTELADELGAEEELGRFDLAFTDALAANVPPPALEVFAAVTRLGDTATLATICIIVAVALCASGHRWLSFAWVLTVAAGGCLNFVLKLVFERIRPVQRGLQLPERP